MWAGRVGLVRLCVWVCAGELWVISMHVVSEGFEAIR